MGYKQEHLIIIFDSNMEVNEIDLNSFGKKQITFGRDSSNQIVLTSSIVSRRHGAFEFVGDKLCVYDCGSTNGLSVNGQLCKTDERGNSNTFELNDGDIIRIDNIGESRGDLKGVIMLYRTSRTPGSWQRTSMPEQGRLLIGRSRECNVSLKNINVSRRHAAVYGGGDGYYIEDLGSANGVFVNGERVNGRANIRNNDIISVASSVLFFTRGVFLYKSQADGTRVVMEHISRAVTVKGRKKLILRDINVTVEPNEFVAIIGGSGAGKTTVMNAMSGFEQASEGRVYVNGTDLYKNYQVLKNIIGYVPQQDIIYENITLMKMLEYSAKMRMSKDISQDERLKRIGEVLKMVELEEHKDKFIRSLSGGQRKRASIAVELLADPGLFFLDEPTSGLDPGTEESLMKTLNRLSKQKGKTIIMVTHTTQNIHLCDKVLFMGKGGVVCFYGSPKDCMQFFGADNMTEIYNMLLTDDQVNRWAAKFRSMQGSGQERKKHGGGKITRSVKEPFIRQFAILSGRYMTLIKNDLQRLIMIFAQPVIIAILLTLVAADDVFDIYNSTQSIMFALSCAGIWVGLFNSIQEICKERNILKREYMANLRLGAYVMSKFFVQLLLSAIQAVIMILIFTMTVGKPEEGVMGGVFMEMFVTMLLTIFSSSAIGLVVSSVSKNSDKAMTAAPFILIIQLLFSGILFKLKGVTEKLSYITVSRWSVSAFGTTGNLNSLEMAIPGMPHEAEKIYDYTASTILSDWCVMAGFAVMCALLCIVLLRNVSKDSR